MFKIRSFPQLLAPYSLKNDNTDAKLSLDLGRIHKEGTLKRHTATAHVFNLRRKVTLKQAFLELIIFKVITYPLDGKGNALAKYQVYKRKK